MKATEIPNKLAMELRGIVPRSTLLVCASLVALSAAVPSAYAIVEKKFIKPVTEKPAAGTRVDVEADRIAYDNAKKIATATGTVRITYGPYVLVATKVVYDQVNDVFKANGSVELREPNGNILQAKTAELRNKFKEGFARHLRALLTNDVTIAAEYAKRTADGITVFENAHYTACVDCATDGGDPLWEITTDKTVHDSNKKTLYHTNPRLKIGGTTVAWLPYAEQPDPSVKRRTGLLLPKFKSGKAYGVGVVTPYFLELGPSADITFSPVWTTRQGPVADIEYRQKLKSGEYNIHGYGVHQFNDSHTDSNKTWRGALTSKGDFELNDVWSYGWDGTLVSDKHFLDRYDFDNRHIVTSQAYVAGLADRDYFSAQTLHFRSLTDHEDQDFIPTALPYVNSEYTLDSAVLGGELSFDWSVYSLARDEANTPFPDINHGTDQTRAIANINWQKQMISDIGQIITPFAKLRSDLYISKNVPGSLSDDEVTNRVLPSAGVDMRWPFISSFNTGQSIITPVFQAIAATDETDQEKIGNEDAISVNFDSASLFLHDRFTGQDRYEGGSRANAGLLYTYLGENGGFARVSLGKSFHVGGKNSFGSGSGLDGSKSDLVGALTFQPWDDLSLSYQARVEEDLSKINVQEAFANYNLDRFSGSLGYLYLGSEPNAGRLAANEEVEAITTFKLSESWGLLGGFKYDLINDQFLSKKAGIVFDCDCMNASLTYTETDTADIGDKTDRTLKLSVELRTIGKTSVSAGF